jgi:hypothetical protein
VPGIAEKLQQKKPGLRACSKALKTKKEKDNWILWRRVERIRSKDLD